MLLLCRLVKCCRGQCGSGAAEPAGLGVWRLPQGHLCISQASGDHLPSVRGSAAAAGGYCKHCGPLHSLTQTSSKLPQLHHASWHRGCQRELPLCSILARGAVSHIHPAGCKISSHAAGECLLIGTPVTGQVSEWVSEWVSKRMSRPCSGCAAVESRLIPTPGLTAAAAAGAQILTSRPAPVPEGMAEDAPAVAAAHLHFLRLAVMPHTRTSRRLEDLQASLVRTPPCYSAWEGQSFAHGRKVAGSRPQQAGLPLHHD